MITLQELFGYLEKYLHVESLVDASHNGLQVEGRPHIKRLGFSVSSSVNAIKKAKALQCDALIVHHGIFWGKDPLMVRGVVKEKLNLLLSSDMSLIAYHLPLDAHQELGNNWKAAKDLGLENLEGFSCLGKNAHLGVKGIIKEIDFGDFVKQLEKYYQHSAQSVLGGKDRISSVAIISGGAHKYIEQAAQEGVDCFITGSCDEPTWHLAHELKINFVALGHYATERICVRALKEHLEKKFSIECEFIDEPNPF